MTFDPSSRYARLPVDQVRLPDGRVASCVRRRFLPQGASLGAVAEVAPLSDERVDQLAARTVGDPERFWRLADANDAMDPRELADPARRVRVPLPEG